MNQQDKKIREVRMTGREGETEKTETKSGNHICLAKIEKINLQKEEKR
jgi:hypothetical protein